MEKKMKKLTNVTSDVISKCYLSSGESLLTRRNVRHTHEHYCFIMNKEGGQGT